MVWCGVGAGRGRGEGEEEVVTSPLLPASKMSQIGPEMPFFGRGQKLQKKKNVKKRFTIGPFLLGNVVCTNFSDGATTFFWCF